MQAQRRREESQSCQLACIVCLDAQHHGLISQVTKQLRAMNSSTPEWPGPFTEGMGVWDQFRVCDENAWWGVYEAAMGRQLGRRQREVERASLDLRMCEQRFEEVRSLSLSQLCKFTSHALTCAWHTMPSTSRPL